ncbi:hypothetical protein BDK51DRAFT_49733 [Blyttiomyces helicus]|uniref:Uncharacterized protein n=1 Tax=Blyttiomyces helicus TaxID=388810 RepID=A0A4P9VVP3_9FUNG|nr:hypothetical protein BDK51DRAFT_49733 [Blyttiomyces helicus]|eukprot:RKO83731.1 hypothetical protein BDK51DRAFT_49733 [Blyttiomyces helicus]
MKVWTTDCGHLLCDSAPVSRQPFVGSHDVVLNHEIFEDERANEPPNAFELLPETQQKSFVGGQKQVSTRPNNRHDSACCNAAPFESGYAPKGQQGYSSIQQLADVLAAHGFHVTTPDFFRGDPLVKMPLVISEFMNNLCINVA